MDYLMFCYTCCVISLMAWHLGKLLRVCYCSGRGATIISTYVERFDVRVSITNRNEVECNVTSVLIRHGRPHTHSYTYISIVSLYNVYK